MAALLVLSMSMAALLAPGSTTEVSAKSYNGLIIYEDFNNGDQTGDAEHWVHADAAPGSQTWSAGYDAGINSRVLPWSGNYVAVGKPYSNYFVMNNSFAYGLDENIDPNQPLYVQFYFKQIGNLNSYQIYDNMPLLRLIGTDLQIETTSPAWYTGLLSAWDAKSGQVLNIPINPGEWQHVYFEITTTQYTIVVEHLDHTEHSQVFERNTALASTTGIAWDGANNAGTLGDALACYDNIIVSAAPIEGDPFFSQASVPVVEIIEPEDSRITNTWTPAPGYMLDIAADVAGYEIEEVVLYLDGELIASDVAAPYAWVLDCGDIALGEHVLRVVARDIDNQTGQDVHYIYLAEESFGIRDILDLSGLLAWMGGILGLLQALAVCMTLGGIYLRHLVITGLGAALLILTVVVL